MTTCPVDACPAPGGDGAFACTGFMPGRLAAPALCSPAVLADAFAALCLSWSSLRSAFVILGLGLTTRPCSSILATGCLHSSQQQYRQSAVGQTGTLSREHPSRVKRGSHGLSPHIVPWRYGSPERFYTLLYTGCPRCAPGSPRLYFVPVSFEQRSAVCLLSKPLLFGPSASAMIRSPLADQEQQVRLARNMFYIGFGAAPVLWWVRS